VRAPGPTAELIEPARTADRKIEEVLGVLDDRGEELALAPEVVAHDAAAVAGQPADFGERDCARAALGDQGHRRRQEPLLGLGAPLLLAAAFLLVRHDQSPYTLTYGSFTK
jgi:hypothetical protein